MMEWERRDGKKPGEQLAECPCCESASIEIERLRATLGDCLAYIKGDVSGPAQRNGIISEAEALLGGR